MLGLAFSRSHARHARAAALLGGLACASLLACVESTSSAPSIAYEDYRASYERAYCDWRASCNLEESAERCVEIHGYETADPYVERAVEAGTIRYDGEMGYQCILELRERSCDQLAEDPTPSCPHVFEGRVAPDEPCLISAECIGEGTCGFDPNTCTEMCCAGECRLPRPPAEIGESCAGNAVDCVEGAYCAVDPVTFQRTVCAAGAAIGAPCGENNVDCDAEGFCDFGASVCRPKLAVGEVCQYGNSCEGDAICMYVDQDYIEQRCSAPGAIGEPCNPLLDSYACRDFGAHCGAAQTCELLPGIGEPCPVGQCAPFAYCDDGTCRAAVGLGEPCSSYGGYSGDIPCEGDLRCEFVDYDAAVCAVYESPTASCEEVPGEPIDAGA